MRTKAYNTADKVLQGIGIYSSLDFLPMLYMLTPILILADLIFSKYGLFFGGSMSVATIDDFSKFPQFKNKRCLVE